MFKEDVDARSGEGPATAAANDDVNPDEPTVNATVADLFDRMKKAMDERMKKMEDIVQALADKVDGLAKKIAPLEAYVNEQLSFMRTYEDNVFRDGVNGNREKEGEPNVTEKDNVEGEQCGEKEGEPNVTEKENVSKEGEQGGESVEIQEEPVKENINSLLKEAVERAPKDAIPDTKPRFKRTKMKSRKRTPEQYVCKFKRIEDYLGLREQW